MPKIIAKWRANKKKGRCISKMFDDQDLYHGMSRQSWDLQDILHPVSDESMILELQEHLKTLK
jgi:hypothetical protein